MKAVLSPWIALVAAVLVSGQVRAGAQSAEVLNWLEKMDRAVRGLSYQGTFVYLHGSQLESMRVEHRIGEDAEKERLSSLNGEPRQVIREDDQVTCISPHSRLVSREGHPAAHPGVPRLLPAHLDKLAEHYNFRLGGQDRVADRSARVLTILRLSLDEEHGLPLKTDMLDMSGEPVVQIMFTELRVDSEQEPAAPQEPRQSALPAQPLSPIQAPGWTFEKLPGGFALIGHELRTQPDGQSLEHLVLSDGLAVVSVYVEETGPERELVGPASMGALNAYGKRYGQYQVTVVGEVPGAMVSAVAESVRPVAQEATP
jgi:sigma-E factor negative regulatory protein RseB